ncbi:MAG: hypothetical protein Hyperionvirus4_80 [Hyperionvirus sp.]|uniref:Uncharacterized protein n=1 Tax=Hyperionvirus sp. TaxID=2487770 RepID=A0A3G5A7A6_9VIRU|nr:MAG: hypothetical protein Hyperionvirus4_80 [Hyperionvirus sp.]
MCEDNSVTCYQLMNRDTCSANLKNPEPPVLFGYFNNMRLYSGLFSAVDLKGVDEITGNILSRKSCIILSNLKNVSNCSSLLPKDDVILKLRKAVDSECGQVFENEEHIGYVFRVDRTDKFQLTEKLNLTIFVTIA